MSREAQLVDLPDQQQKPKVSICSPKIIILSILALYFASQNLYNYLTLPKPANPMPKVEIDEWKQFWELFDKFQSYLYITVISFIVFYYLRRENDKFQEEQYLKKLKQEEELLEQENRKQREREEKIFRKLEEEEKQEKLRQSKLQQNINNQQPTNSDYTQQEKRQKSQGHDKND